MHASPITINSASLLRELAEIKYALDPAGELSLERILADYKLGLSRRLIAEQSPPLRQAIETYLSALPPTLSLRTRSEYTTYLRRILRDDRENTERRLFDMQEEHCITLLRRVFPTAHGRNKAHRLLHTFFEYARRQKWIPRNPIRRVATDAKDEANLRVLNAEEMKRLMQKLRRPRYRELLVPLALILWESFRLSEIAKLQWQEVLSGSWKEPLQSILRRYPHPKGSSMRPKRWRQLWYRLRKEIGLPDITVDTLRHTGIACRILCRIDIEKPDSASHTLRQLIDDGKSGITWADAAAIWRGTTLLSGSGE